MSGVYVSVCSVDFSLFNAPATTDIYTYGHTLSLHAALPLYERWPVAHPGHRRRHRHRSRNAAARLRALLPGQARRESRAGGTILSPTRSEENKYELQSLMRKSYAVYCLKQIMI